MNYNLSSATPAPRRTSRTSCWPTSRFIQLSKTDYGRAVDRFDTMKDWIDREGSDLHGLVSLLYPQGSMAVGSTVARVSDRDEYDIDVIADLAIRHDSNPQLVLDALFDLSAESAGRAIGGRPSATRAVSASPSKTACTSI